MTTQASEDKNAQAAKCLRIGSQAELEEFWVQILPAFVDVVDPDSGFLIDLYSGGELLTDTDYESLVTGKDRVPTKHRARRLWCILSTYPLGVFNWKLAPKLVVRYGPIIPERFLTTPAEGLATGEAKPEEQCLRHAIQNRVRLETLADLLCHHRCLPQDVYRKLFTIIPRNLDEKWDLLFDALAQCPKDIRTNLEPAFQHLLCRYNVTCPHNMADILSFGFPCMCKHPQSSPPADTISSDRLVQFWLERKLSTVHPHSSDSSLTRVDVSTCSLSSSPRPVSYLDRSSSSSMECMPCGIAMPRTAKERSFCFDEIDDMVISVTEETGLPSDIRHTVTPPEVCHTEVTAGSAEIIPMKLLANNNSDTFIEVDKDTEDAHLIVPMDDTAETQVLMDLSTANQECANALSLKRRVYLHIIYFWYTFKNWLHEFEQYYEEGFHNILPREWQLVKTTVKKEVKINVRGLQSCGDIINCNLCCKTFRLSNQFRKFMWRLVPLYFIFFTEVTSDVPRVLAPLLNLFIVIVIVISVVGIGAFATFTFTIGKTLFGMVLASFIVFVKMLVQKLCCFGASDSTD